jgi:hypothetical protein
VSISCCCCSASTRSASGSLGSSCAALVTPHNIH